MTSTSGGSMSEKGAKYFGLLDQALCSGSWGEIPELARKTEKHAPERKCFTLTARSEAQIASASHRPTSAESSATSSIHGLGELVPKLEKAIQEEKRFAEDAFAARVCLAEVYWLREDAEKAVRALEDGGAATTKEGSGGQTAALGWLEVCEVKANLIRVAALEAAGREEDARQLYLELCQKNPGSRTPELRKWTERLLAKACMSMSRNLSNPTLGALSDSLRCFHAWSDFWSRAPSATSRAPSSFAYLDIPRRPVWKAYYDLLSLILQYNLLYNPASTPSSDLLVLSHNRMADEQYTTARRRQRAELRRVEATYESLLLDETQFPKASQTNTEVEEWVQQAMANWSIFCSSAWLDVDLGEGGQQGVSRGVLDILYRAATKTFHSTSILRCLFGVHAALGDFELALHAFDSYVELVDKAKARAAKSKKHELGFDSDDSVLLTAAEAVRVLCRYGDREQGEKAMRVVKTIEAWLEIDKSNAQKDLDLNENAEKPREEGEINEASWPNGVKRDDEHADAERPKLQPTTLAAVYRAIGIAQAHWARLTYETDSRSKLQTDALQNLRLAQRQDPNAIATAYTLAFLLAETGEIGNATTTLKSVIAAANASNPDEDDDDDEDELSPNEISKMRQLVPLWHLLALCLSAKDDYEQAARMCTSAFEQFGEPAILFGDDSNRDSIDTSNTSSRSARAIVGQMDGFEKEGLVQVKMSQLALVELMEGAEAAVDVSYELLALYGRLFGNVELMKPISRPPHTAASATPSKLGGTLRSLAGSIRPRSARTSMERGASRQEASGDARPSSTSAGQRGGAGADGSSIGVPIAITVTNEDGVPTEKPHHQHHHFPFKIRGQHGDWREYGNLKSSQSNSSMREKRSTMGSERPLSTVNETPKPPAVPTVVHGEAEKTESRDGPASPEQPLGKVAHNAPHDAWPPPPGHKDQPPRQDVRLPAPHPSSGSAMVQPRLPSVQERQQKISLLAKIWLFIAGMYVRADLFEDAAGAVAEAEKLVESFENEIGAEHASARRFFEKGWAGGKSVDGLWGDFWGAKGDLAASRAQPFAALRAYEQALQYYPDHPEAIIGLSNLLMDIYEQKLPAEEPKPLLSSASSASGGPSAAIPPPPRPPMVSRSSATSTPKVEPPQKPSRVQDPTPAELNRLACRDRAYMLLSTLTRLGSGWDHSEAWLTLARSYELSKQVGKAKQALWWVVELEERRPMRPWMDVGAGGFTL